MTGPRHVLIGICTFRRDHVTATLASLGGLVRPEGVTIAACIADNDTAPSARDRVTDAARDLPFAVSYLHAPARNISVARNAVLDHAAGTGARWLAFLDDDEVVDEGWLAALLARAGNSGCAAVVGPVHAAYGDGAPGWMRRGAVHDTLPDETAPGIAHTGYTCNLLLDLADPRIAGLRFDMDRGTSGGEDTVFLTAYQRAGGEIAFAPDAVVRETVPAARARLGWLLQRRFRMGQTHGQLVCQQQGGTGRLTQVGLAGLKCGYCLGMAVVTGLDPLRRNRALMRGALHAGAVAGGLGARHLQIYGDKPSGTKKRT